MSQTLQDLRFAPRQVLLKQRAYAAIVVVTTRCDPAVVLREE